MMIFKCKQIFVYQETIFVPKSGVLEGDSVVFEEPHVGLVAEEPESHVLLADVETIRQKLLDLTNRRSTTEGSLENEETTYLSHN